MASGGKDPPLLALLVELQATLETLVCGKDVSQILNKEINLVIKNLDTLDNSKATIIARAIIIPYASIILTNTTNASLKMAQFIIWWMDNKAKDVPQGAIKFVLDVIRERKEFHRPGLKFEYV